MQKTVLMLGADTALEAGREGLPDLGEVEVHLLGTCKIGCGLTRSKPIVATLPPTHRDLEETGLQAVLGLIGKVSIAVGTLLYDALAVCLIPACVLGTPRGCSDRRGCCATGTARARVRRTVPTACAGRRGRRGC